MKHDDYPPIRLCQDCARNLDLWAEFSAANSPYDHATTQACSVCDNITFTAVIPTPAFLRRTKANAA